MGPWRGVDLTVGTARHPISRSDVIGIRTTGPSGPVSPSMGEGGGQLLASGRRLRSGRDRRFRAELSLVARGRSPLPRQPRSSCGTGPRPCHSSCGHSSRGSGPRPGRSRAGLGDGPTTGGREGRPGVGDGAVEAGPEVRTYTAGRHTRVLPLVGGDTCKAAALVLGGEGEAAWTETRCFKCLTSMFKAQTEHAHSVWVICS